MGLSKQDSTNKISAGIVLYNPDIETLRENILHIMPQVRQVVLFDNGSSNLEEIEALQNELLPKGQHHDALVLMKNPENGGIALALNRLCHWAAAHDYPSIITLDQDSVCAPDLVEKLMEHMADDVAVVSPQIVYKDNEAYSVHGTGVEPIDWAITSGSLMNLAVWKELQGFDERLFIDGVDYDYGMRAKERGYKTLRTYDAQLMHELGNLQCKVVFGRTIYVTNHSARRRYYMIRNAIYLKKKLHTGNPAATIAKELIKVVFFEDDKAAKLSSIRSGIRDGIKFHPKDS